MKKQDDEKNRELSPAEKRRAEQFNELSKKLEADGYNRTDLTVGIVKANMVVLIATVPLFIVGIFLFYIVNRGRDFDDVFSFSGIMLLIMILVMIPIHELIHGVTWSLFTSEHFKAIEFGIMKQYLTPYCTCKVPLNKGPYIAGALMPLILLGIVPAVYGILAGSFLWLVVGLIMILSAGGDIMIVLKMLRYHTNAEDILYLDHPTQAGLVVFERA